MKTIFKMVALLLVATTFDGISEEKVTYSKDIAPLIQKKCVECHREGAGAPFALTDYRSVARKAGTIARVVDDRYMPPWHAVGGDLAFADDRRLNADEIDLFAAWKKSGSVEGDPADLPPPREFPDGWALGEPDLILEMEESFDVPADGPDVYRNFVIRTGLKKKKFLKAIEFRPSTPAVVHHALFYGDSTGRARKEDLTDEGPGFAEMPIGQGAGRTLGGWVPGTKPRPLPEGLARTLEPESDLVIQIHFHPVGKAESERSVVGLYFDDKPPKRVFTSIQLPPLFGAFSGIDIPPGQDHVEVIDSFELPVAVKAFGAQPHSHYRGKSLGLKAHLPNGEVLTLLNIPEWDMDWQEEYRFQKEVSLPARTRLESRIVWDNSAASPGNPILPPVRVRWGLESYDEMGSIDLFVIPEGGDKQSRAGLKTLRSRYRDHIAWQAGSHVLSPEKLSVFGSLREKAIAKFDKDGDGVLGSGERAAARLELRAGVLP